MKFQIPDNDMDPKKRFSSRVENYIKYRPGYPGQIIDFFKLELQISPGKIIADIGSGTGIFSELLLENNYTVYAVEPNDEMRIAAEKKLIVYPNFFSVKGSAEESSLGAGLVDAVTAAQAFHWFVIPDAKKEFKRILKNKGWVILLWNTRVNEASDFMNEYEKFLLQNSIDYTKVAHTDIDEAKLNQFFSGLSVKYFHNVQVFDFESLKGRVLSSSYMPDESSDLYPPMLKALHNIFSEHNQNGFVEFIYKTEVYFGRL